MRTRPSLVIVYSAFDANPPIPVFPPVTMRDGKSAAGAPPTPRRDLLPSLRALPGSGNDQ
jgi:hypothetical protein